MRNAGIVLPGCVALLFLFACSGSGSSPTEPPTPVAAAGATQKSLSTQWGSISLFAGNCDSVDYDQITASVERGYERAREQVGSVVDSIRLDGMVMSGDQNLVCAGTAAYGCYFFDRDTVYFRCGSENVINHELQHRFCDRLGNSCDCTQTDHAGGNDLNCQPA